MLFISFSWLEKQDLKNNGKPRDSKKKLWPVHMAAHKEHLKVFQFLTENMHSNKHGNNNGNPLALHFAALFGHLNTICKHIIEELTD